MRAYPLRGQVGGGWALEIDIFGPFEMTSSRWRVPFGAQKLVVGLHPPEVDCDEGQHYSQAARGL
jgi:hypothetical protein